MDTLITRLEQQTDGLDTTDLAPDEHLPSVVRRGRRYLVAASAATIVGVTASVAVAAVAVPQLVEQLRGPEQPVVEPISDEPVPPPVEEEGAADEEPEETTEDSAPVDEAAVEQDKPAAQPEEDPVPADVTAPDVVVLSPGDGATVTSEKVTFTGQVEPGATVTAGPYAATVKDDGSWSILLIAEPGDNPVTFTATDAAGNTATTTVTVTFTPKQGEEKPGDDPAPDKPAEDPQPDKPVDDPVADTKAFTANQKHGELTAAPHINTYWGTAKPGEKVKVLSDFGWAYTWADEAGNWEVQVDFAPPAGTKTFAVTARYYHDSTVARSFQLTTVAPEAAAFTATQQKSSVSAGSPTNVYSGTGEPGHEVLIYTEAHGQTTTTVAADGTWQVTMTYQGAVPGETFPVKAADMTGGTRHYFEVTVTE